MYRKVKKMCKYCKKLKEIKDLDENRYQEIINTWRRRDLKARKLIQNLVQIQVFDLDTQAELLNEARQFVNTTWIGK